MLVLMLATSLAQATVAVFGAPCAAERKGSFGAFCSTPVAAQLAKGCAVDAAQRRIIESYYGRTSLHHRAQLHYAFPRDAGGDTQLAIFLSKPVSGTPNSYEVLNLPGDQSEGLVYERCGNLVHAGAPYGI